MNPTASLIPAETQTKLRTGIGLRLLFSRYSNKPCCTLESNPPPTRSWFHLKRGGGGGPATIKELSRCRRPTPRPAHLTRLLLTRPRPHHLGCLSEPRRTSLRHVRCFPKPNEMQPGLESSPFFESVDFGSETRNSSELAASVP